MGVENFITRPEPKKLIFALLHNRTPGVACFEDEKKVLYIINNPLTLEPFIAKLLGKKTNVSIVYEFYTLNEICDFFKFLYQQTQLGTILFQQNVTIVVNRRFISTYSIKSTLTIQLIRYLSLKHHCQIVSTDKEIYSKMISLESIDKLIDLENVKVQPNYVEARETGSEPHFDLFIPSSWDSWNRIIVHGKSVIISPDNDRVDGIIRDEKVLEMLDQEYEAQISEKNSQVSALANYLSKYDENPEPKESDIAREKVPKTMNEFLQEVLNLDEISAS
ncbi:hypothetical protein KGF56_001429 [Candida oxycetoniae]|uniref:Uncharacterized protein n=1 Tax=Candida oxycetoniae TaxID=497107 RepID=A0AAI9SZU1_9ASCO|nr:uncharacterized protein KGF56_001429 [Candida oxycetoniae]KAI3405822.1 hypothetical protein KGF56_001429 [Candida oxycetoniae]